MSIENANDRLNIDITDYWMIIKKRFIHILFVFFLVLIAVWSYTQNLKPVYQAVCKIKVSTRQPMATIEGAQINWYGARGNELQSEISLITSKEEILEIVSDLMRKYKNIEEARYFSSPEWSRYFQDVRHLLPDYYHLGEQDEQDIRNITIPSNLQSAISVELIPSTNIVELKIKGGNPKVVRALANTLAVAYRADYWRGRTREAEDTRDFISDQLDKITGQIKKNLEDVKEASSMETFLGDVEVYRTELSRLRIELERLRDSYQENHPRVIKQKRLVQTIEEQLARFPQAEVQRTETLAEQDQKFNLQKTLAELKLKADIDYEAKRIKAKDEVQIISPAEGASQLSPNSRMNIIVGAVFGLILGCLSAFIWEGLDTSIGKIEDVERITKLPVIAHVPLIGGSGEGFLGNFFRPVKIIWRQMLKIIPFRSSQSPLDLYEKILFNFDTMSTTAEAYRTLRTNIQFAIGAGHVTRNVIAVTSTSPQEGKTLTSTNLAIALAQLGKATLLIEGDMRRPQIARLFRIDQRPGLSDIMIGTAKVDNAIRTFTDILMGNSEWDKLMESQGIDNLHLLPCGTIPPNPSELLLSTEFREMIDNLRERYDFIIIDTPPTLPVSDSSIIGTVADGTVLIYQSDTTSRHLLLRAIQTLNKNQARMLGIVINQLSFDVVMQTSGGKYGYAYGSYGKKPDETI